MEVLGFERQILDRIENKVLVGMPPSFNSDGRYVRFREPVAITDLWDESFNEWFEYDEDFSEAFPWGLGIEPLFMMDWEKANPMFPSSISLDRLKGPAGWDLIVHFAEPYPNEPSIAAAVKSDDHQALRTLLQDLFRTNGASLGVELVAAPPSDILFHEVLSFDFLVNLFVALFDSLPHENGSWQELTDTYAETVSGIFDVADDWRETQLVPSAGFSEEIENFIVEYDQGKPAHLSFASGRAWSGRRARAIEEFRQKNEIADRIVGGDLTTALEALEAVKKPLMVAEYLSKVLNSYV